MTKTNLSHSSKLLAALAMFALLTAAVAPAAAVSVASTDAPDTGEVGTQVTATVTLDALYKDPSLEQWQLAGSTGLNNVTWTVTWYDQTGAKVNQQSFDGGNFSGATVSAAENHAEVQVKVTGTVPAIEQFSYEPQQQFLLVELQQTRSGGTSNEILSRTATHYTEDSREARQALDAAAAAIDAAGNAPEASKTFDNAVSAYNAGNFDNAIDLANTAEKQAKQAQSAQQRNRLIMYGVAALVVVALVVGGVLYWRSQQDSYDKLG
ncbi:hypothetical protein [Halobaculum sp. P14]|uniref:hypothetical protein n=1 Tax=Halobaculum sp. P14 TaxID=3421638 RepID=UPI003EBA18AA